MGNKGWRRIAWAWVFLVACDGNPFREAPSLEVGGAISGKTPPKLQGPRLVEQDVPTEPPFIGQVGIDEHGHPTQLPDKVKLLSLLRVKRFKELTKFITFYQEQFEEDYRKEAWPDAAISSFFQSDPTLEPLLNEWVQLEPESFAARMARGNYRYNVGWHFRGEKFASETSVRQFRTMHEFFVGARSDFETAIELRPRCIAGYRRLLQIAMVASMGDAYKREVLDASFAQCALCFAPRAVYLSSLDPKWGGSYEQMEAFIEETKPWWGQNSKLETLRAMPHSLRCDVATREKRFEEAHHACDAAIAAGRDIMQWTDKAHLFRKEKRYDKARELIDRAYARDPQERSVLEERFYILAALHDYVEAGSMLITWRALDPADEDMGDHVKWTVERLRRKGYELEQAGAHEDAAKAFSIALRLAPDDKDLMGRMGHSQKRTGQTQESIQAQLAAAPDDFALRQRIDYGLASARRFDEVVSMWDEFIARHPADARAYSERGGAKWHLRKLDEAIADMQRACDLGMDKACKDASGMKAAAQR